jgi:hypothetical protein
VPLLVSHCSGLGHQLIVPRSELALAGAIVRCQRVNASAPRHELNARTWRTPWSELPRTSRTAWDGDAVGGGLGGDQLCYSGRTPSVVAFWRKMAVPKICCRRSTSGHIARAR